MRASPSPPCRSCSGPSGSGFRRIRASACAGSGMAASRSSWAGRSMRRSSTLSARCWVRTPRGSAMSSSRISLCSPRSGSPPCAGWSAGAASARPSIPCPAGGSWGGAPPPARRTMTLGCGARNCCAAPACGTGPFTSFTPRASAGRARCTGSSATTIPGRALGSTRSISRGGPRGSTRARSAPRSTAGSSSTSSTRGRPTGGG